jgi:hypothetical protein
MPSRQKNRENAYIKTHEYFLNGPNQGVLQCFAYRIQRHSRPGTCLALSNPPRLTPSGMPASYWSPINSSFILNC